MLDFGFYNMDCMVGMKEFPDKYFDLAIVDPPYGGGFTEGGGCQGWFTKYHQDNGVGGVLEQVRRPLRQVQRDTSHSDSARPTRIIKSKGNKRKNNQKNHLVGHCPETRLFRRIVSCLT